MSALAGVSTEVIEHARKRVGVASDWEVDWCANACGEFVFYPPDAREAALAQRTPFVLTCSSECLHEILQERRFRS